MQLKKDLFKRRWAIALSCVALLGAGMLVAPGCGTEISFSNFMATMIGYDSIESEKQDQEPAPEHQSQEQQNKVKAEDIIKEWPKPDVAFFISGRLHGYIEPCGCTGLENQKGGLLRRRSCQKVFLDRGWDLISIDAGNQVRRFGQQPVIKLGKTYEILCSIMKYDVIGFGPEDLKLPTIEFAQTMLNSQNEENGNPFTSANVLIFEDDSMANSFRVFNKNGVKVGVTSILGDEHKEDLSNQSELKIIDMAKSLETTIPKMKAQGCEFKVLVAQTTSENCEELAKAFPYFDLLISTGSFGDPIMTPESVTVGNHTTKIVQVGVKGMHVGVVGYYRENPTGQKIQYKRIPLDERFEDSEDVKKVFLAYQAELKDLYVNNQLQDIRPRKHPSGAKFIGSETCNDCHDEEYEIWLDGIDGEGGPHPVATADLKVNPNSERMWVERQYDPECLSCHVTGWNPKNYYPYESGYIDFKKDVHLHGNGCENCHGPGSNHVAAENGDGNFSEAQMMTFREQMRQTKAEAKKDACMECHDLDNSPDFLKDGGFEKYWEKIKHGPNVD